MPANPNLPKILVLGDLNIDVFLQVDAYPQPGGDAFAHQMVIATGGSAVNTAIVLAQLGCQPHLLAQAGADAWAGQALQDLHQAGVNTDSVRRDPSEATGMIFLPVTPDGERTMFSYRGANRRLDPDTITPETLAGVRWLHLSGYAFLEAPQSEAAWRAVMLAGQMNIPISLDIGVEPAYQMGTRLTDLLPRLSLLVLGEPEARAIAMPGAAQQGAASEDAGTAAAEALAGRGVGLVGLKRGGQGCQLVTAAGALDSPGFAVPVVDTTGAGDAFSAGLLFALLHGLSLPAAGLLANALGALAATAWGAGASLPKHAQLLAFLGRPENRRPGQETELDEVLQALKQSTSRRPA